MRVKQAVNEGVARSGETEGCVQQRYLFRERFGIGMGLVVHVCLRHYERRCAAPRDDRGV